MALDPPDETVIRVATAASLLARRAGTQINQVAEWVDHALTLVERSGTEDDRLELVLGRAMLRYSTGTDFAGAQADAETVMQACVGVPHRVRLLAQAARQLSVSGQVTGNHELAQRAATMALEQIERYGDDNDFAILLDTLSMWFGLAGYRRLTGLVRWAAAEQYAERNAGAISLWTNLAAGLTPDDPAQSAVAAQRAMELARDFGMTEVIALGHLVTSYLNLGRWTEATQLLRERREVERSELIDWETYVLADSAVVAWETEDASQLLPRDDGGKDSEDAILAAWWCMYDAVATAYGGDVAAGARRAAEAVEKACTIGPANEDVPLAYALAVDMLREVDDRETLARITEPLAALPIGARFRLLHGQLLRVEALLSDSAVEGLRRAVDVLDAMGAAFWAARVRVDLARSLADAGDASGALAALNAAEPMLRDAAAARVLRKVDALRARDDLARLTMPRQAESEPSTVS
jgi:hypothetical protein